MKTTILAFLLICCNAQSWAQNEEKPSLRSILLEQLKTTHTVKDWFVPVNVAIEGINAEQANWTDGTGNHSIGQLVHHLAFWNERLLHQFKELPSPAFSGNNEETFNDFDAKTWDQTVQKLDSIMTEWETVLAQAEEEKLHKWYSNIAHMGTHNAYHTGQIVYLRKLQGIWDASKGVK